MQDNAAVTGILDGDEPAVSVGAHRPAAYGNDDVIMTARDISMRGLTGRIYSGVSMRVPRGKVTALCGENNSGKTELLLTLAGRMLTMGGTLVVDGYELPRQRRKMRREAGLGFFENVNDVQPSLKVNTLVAAELELYGRKSNKRATAAYIHDWGLDEIANLRAEVLSAEQTVLLGIALGMVPNPAILCVDDIETDLTTHQGRKLMAYLRRLASERDMTVLVGCTEYEIARGADAVVLLTSDAAAQRDKVESDIVARSISNIAGVRAGSEPPVIVGYSAAAAVGRDDAAHLGIAAVDAEEGGEA